MYKHITIGGVVIALFLSILALVGGNTQPASIDEAKLNKVLGGSTSDNWSVGGNLSVTGTSALTGDVTVSGGTLNVSTSNTATSTVIGGCFQFYATSTATASKFQASTTPGIMYSQYGTCPNL